MGCAMSIGIVISYYNIVSYKDEKLYLRLFYLITLFLGIITIALFASRGAFLAMVLPIIFISFKRFHSIRSIFLITSFLSIIILGFSLTNYFDALIVRFTDASLFTGSTRTEVWSGSLKLFFNSDLLTFLFGGGSHYSYEICGEAVSVNHFTCHNDFLAILYDYGVFGLIAFVVVLVKLVKSSIKNVLGISLIIVLLITCMTLNPLDYIVYWFLLVLINKQQLKGEPALLLNS
jgi:hypothetical protein